MASSKKKNRFGTGNDYSGSIARDIEQYSQELYKAANPLPEPKATKPPTQTKPETAKDNGNFWDKVAAALDKLRDNNADSMLGPNASTPSAVEALKTAREKSNAKKAENDYYAAIVEENHKGEKNTSGVKFSNETAADSMFGDIDWGNATYRGRAENVVYGASRGYTADNLKTLQFLTSDEANKVTTTADAFLGDVQPLTDELPFVKKLKEKISDWASGKSDEYRAESNEAITMAKKGLGTVGSLAVDTGVAAVQMAYDAGIGMATGSGIAPMATRSFGGGLYEAEEAGATGEQAFDYALSSAAVEVLTEKLGNISLPFAKAYGVGALDDVIKKAIEKNAKTKAGRQALGLLVSMASEGGEEVISGLMSPLLKSITYDKTATKDFGKQEFWDDLLEQFAVGAALGGLGGSVDIISTAKTDEQAQIVTPVEAVVKAAKGDTGAENSQLNIDNTANLAYNSNENGGVVNELLGTSGERISQRDGYNRSGESGRENGRRNLSLAGTVGLTNEAKESINQRGIEPIDIPMSMDNAAFSVALNAAKENNPVNGWAVWGQKVDDLNGKTVYISDNGAAGFAISDGDIEAVFSNKKAGAPKSTLASLMPQAIAAGGRKLDCFGEILVNSYAKYGGMRPVARVEFNDKSAPDDWTPDKGRPYIYFMVATDTDPNTIVAKQGTYPIYSQEELNALKTFTTAEYGDGAYDAADKYRREMVAQTEEPTQNLDKLGNPLPEGMGAASAGFEGQLTPGEQWVAEAQAEGDSAVHPISDTAIENLAEQQQRAPQDIPKVDLNGHLTSKTVSTAANSGVTTQEMSDAIVEDAAQGKFSHIAYSDNEAIASAEATIEHYGWEQALGQYRQNVLDGKVSKDNTALGITLYNNAVTNNDFATAMDILLLMTKNSTTMAQGLQAMNILNKISPDGRLYAALKSVENISEEMKKKYGLDDDIEIDPNLISEYRDALQSGDKDAVKSAWSNIQQNIADQIPSNWKDKLNAWRYLAMLGNPRTHFRNILGNAGFALVRGMKNVLAAAIEMGVDKVSKSGIERTKAFLNPASAADRVLIATAWANYEEASQVIMGGGKFNDLPNEINDRRTIFKTKPLEAARKANAKALDIEDKWFSQPAYAAALAGYLKANGISAQAFADGSVGEAAKTKAMEYAIKEAQKATYRDTNAFSKAVSKWKINNGVGHVLLEGLLPFKKTPANILARAVEYSPLGLTYYMTAGTKSVKDGKMTPAEFIDGLSSGLTGTGIVALGAFLAAQGLLTGGGDDNDELAKLQGYQDYAINIGSKSYTLDWLAPEALPLFVGVELWNNFLGQENENASFWSFIGSFMNMIDPITEMSMMSGVQDAISAIRYSDKPLLPLLVQLTTGYISQIVPTLGGQIERSFLEDERETTFYDKEGDTPTSIQTFWGKLLNKVPGVDYNQIPYIDAWGRRESTGSLSERMFNNFINPAYTSDIVAEDFESELKRLYELGNTAVYPKRPGADTKINGEYLTAEEYVQYATVRGETSLDMVKKIINSSQYSSMSDSEKAYAIERAYDYANDVAKLSVKPDADVPKWVREAKSSSNPMSYIYDRVEDKFK